MMRSLPFYFLAVISLLAACSPFPTSSSTQEAETEATTPNTADSATENPPTPSPSPPPAPTATAEPEAALLEPTVSEADSQENKPVLVYQRRGGPQNGPTQWSLYRDGRIVDDQGREQTVRPAQVTRLLETIESLGFFTIKESDLPEEACCQGMTHTITSRWNEQTNTLTVSASAPETPDNLQQILEEVQQVIKPGLIEPPPRGNAP